MKKILLLMVVTVLSIMFAVQPTYALSTDGTDFSDKKIVFFGDSITQGSAVSETDKFASIVANDLGFGSYINMGLSGSAVNAADASSAVAAGEDRVEDIPTDADYIVMLYGINDKSDDVTTADFAVSYAVMVDYIVANIPDAQLIVTTYFDYGITATNTNGDAWEDFNDEIVTLSNGRTDGGSSANENLQLLDIFNLIDVPDDIDNYTVTAGDVHLNETGHQLMANIITSFIDGENIYDGGFNSGLMDCADGTISESSLYVYTDQIDIVAGEVYEVYAMGGVGLTKTLGTIFNVDGDVIASINGDDFTVNNTWFTFTAPANSDYMIINLRDIMESVFFVRHIVDEFVVTYDTNCSYDVQEVYAAYETIDPPATPTNQDYSFGGWFTNESLTVEYDFTSEVDDNITLYAKWVSADGSTGVSGTVTTTTEPLEILGLTWYWWIAIGAAAYLLLTKKGRKMIGLK